MPRPPELERSPEHVDVLIVGAGLSGIGAAYHVQTELPGRSYAIVEARGAIGGTWDLFRYPGVRSDSDMHTLGYRFRPWKDAKSIADGASIRQYVRDTAAEAGIDRHIRFHRKVRRASWSSDAARWTVELEDTQTGETSRITCGLLYGCSGYYRYDRGHDPDFPGKARFQGRIVHPQFWPEDLDYAGKRVVIIGSGATAVTLLPAMTDVAAHVTMLQRTPTYVLTVPGSDPIANKMRGKVPERLAYAITRWKNVAITSGFYQLTRHRPDLAREMLTKQVERQLPKDFDVGTHFNPPYNPWDQRLCAVPDGDLFRAIRQGRASIVTDRIATFTERGILLESGKELEADVIVTATGLELLPLGGIELVVDGEKVEVEKTFAYKGMMLSSVPNFVFTVGYTNSSWTLKADLVAEHTCRLLRHMDAHGYDVFVPENDDPTVEPRPLLDFPAGYVLRAIDKFPKAGSKKPWRLGMNYAADVVALRHGAVVDRAMKLRRSPGAGVARMRPADAHPLRTREVRSGEVTLHVVEDGDPKKPAILFLHGFPDRHDVWEHQLRALAADFHVIAFDMRGVGASSAAASPEGYRIDRLLPDIEAVIDATRGPAGDVHLVAHDWGSVIAWAYVAEPRHARRVRSFTSISGPHVGTLLESAKRAVLGEDGVRQGAVLRQVLQSSYVYALNVPGLGERFFDLTGAKGWRHALREGGVPRHDPYLDVTDDDVRRITRNPIRLYQQNLRHPPAPLAPRSVRVPTLLVIPTRDRFVRPESLDLFDEVCTDLERATIDANHWVQRSHPDALTTLVRRFVGAHDRAADAEANARQAGGSA